MRGTSGKAWRRERSGSRRPLDQRRASLWMVSMRLNGCAHVERVDPVQGRLPAVRQVKPIRPFVQNSSRDLAFARKEAS